MVVVVVTLRLRCCCECWAAADWERRSRGARDDEALDSE